MLSHNSEGEAHAKWAEACAKNGVPLAMLDEKGTLYLPIGVEPSLDEGGFRPNPQQSEVRRGDSKAVWIRRQIGGSTPMSVIYFRRMIGASQVTEGNRERLVRASWVGGVSAELFPPMFPFSPL
jgi:hypothetical protein